MTETDISKVLIEGEYATIMGVKYKRVEEPKKPETLYDIIVRWWGDAETQDKDPIIADLVDDIEKWLPKEKSAAGSQTEKTIQLNLTEEQFNMIWNALVLSEDELVDEGDIMVRIETLNEMEDIMEELGLEVFGDVDDD